MSESSSLKLQKAIEEAMQNMFQEFNPKNMFQHYSHRQLGNAFEPYADVVQTKDETFVSLELPGVDKESIVIEAEDRILTVTGKVSDAGKDKVQGEVECAERPKGKFYRKIHIHSSSDLDSISSSYSNGILELHIPKAQNQSPRRIPIC